MEPSGNGAVEIKGVVRGLGVLPGCPVCGHEEFRDLDHLRDVEYWRELDMRGIEESVGFRICLGCGFLTYHRPKTEAELRAYYKRDYRQALQWLNIVTCNRKNNYHRAFLGEWLKARTDADGWFPVCDVGCAQGSFLKMLHDEFAFPKDMLHGTEWGEGFRDYAVNEYGMDVGEDIDPSRKYGLICLYHVLEHLIDPARDLRRYCDLLEDDGRLYISVPVWLELCDEAAGSRAEEFEYLYHVNHINTFTAKSLRNLLAVCGFAVDRENTTYYGHTLLLKKAEPIQAEAIQREDPSDIEERVDRQRKAMRLLKENRPAEAVAIDPLFPDAHISLAHFKENFRDEKAMKGILDRAIELMPNSAKLRMQRAMVELSWAEQKEPKYLPHKYTNGVKRAEEMFEHADRLKPGLEDVAHFRAIIELVYKRNTAEAVKWWRRGLKTNPSKFTEFETYIGHAWGGVQLPTPGGSDPMAGTQGMKPSEKVTMVAVPGLHGMVAEVTAKSGGA